MPLDSETLDEIDSPLNSTKHTPSSPPSTRISVLDRKVEVPLLQADERPPSLYQKKRVSFNEAFTELVPNVSVLSTAFERHEREAIDMIPTHSIASTAPQVEHSAEQEPLQEPDTSSPDPEEEKLEGCHSSVEKDLESLLRKRKLEIDDDIQGLRRPSEKVHRSSASAPSRYEPAGGTAYEANISHDIAASGHGLTKSQNPFSSAFSVLDAVGTFIGVRKGIFEYAKAGEENNIPVSRSKERHLEHKPQPALHDHSQKDAAGLLRTVVQAKAILTPQLKLPERPRLIIFSSAFLRNRRLTRQVMSRYPSAEIIERDLTIHNPISVSSSEPKTKALLGSAGGLLSEADIVISPGVGLLWTSLQKAKQRSLPGQISHSALRDRIVSTASCYERLFVLVSQGIPRQDAGPIDLDQSDFEALSDLMGFCSSLLENVETIFVPGGEEELSTWMVALMIKHSISSGNMPIAQEETPRENFLRRAGMNTFAAQALLSHRGALSDPLCGLKYGLFQFVGMSLEEKLKDFEELFGGRKLLSTSHQVFNARW
ncbi:MAG: hypothetical protein Q9163_002168 [Psora crenata]